VSIASRGHFGSVYKVHLLKNNKYYALKEVLRGPQRVKIGLKYFDITAEENKQLVLNEADIMEFLSESSPTAWFPEYYGRFHTKNEQYLLLEWVDGLSIDDFGKTLMKLDDDTDVHKDYVILFLIEELFKAIFWLHDNGLVHADLNPTNIIVGETDTSYSLKIIDFGLSCGYVGMDCAILGRLRYNRTFEELKIRDLIRLRSIMITLLYTPRHTPMPEEFRNLEWDLSNGIRTGPAIGEIKGISYEDIRLNLTTGRNRPDRAKFVPRSPT
jgi:serine/threonine protein kinase